jgi:hypothetical protein
LKQKLSKITKWAKDIMGIKKKPEVAIPMIVAKDYNQVWYEMETLRSELREMSDSSLISTVSELSQMFVSGHVDMIVEDFMITGTLDPEDRQELEQYYFFVNMDMGISV